MSIRWKKGDYIRLGKAVADFNKKITALEEDSKKLYLPEKLDYQNIKNDIYTRRELNNIINSLRRFMREDASELYVTEAGEKMTKWERRELGLKARTGIRNLRKDLAPFEVKDESGFSKAQMGFSEAKSIKSNIENLQNLEKISLNKIKPYINFIGRSDYDYKKAAIYRENYMSMLEKIFSSQEHYQDLVDYLNEKYKNPVDFWKFIKDFELLQDIKYMYEYEAQGSTFERMLDELGIPYE